MRSIVVYYSYSGNTKEVAKSLAGVLSAKGEADIIELQGLDESGSFFSQCKRAFRKVRGKIQEVRCDLSGYDLICIGTPVWAFGPAPSVNTYLDKCSGLEAKEVLLFSTYGSGTGNSRCLDYMQEQLSQKGVKNFRRFSIQGAKVKNKESLLARINKALPL
jgi:flavodoxin